MAKREFLQLLHKYDEKKHFINSWFVSDKLDGRRVFWDGGISRNLKTEDVPYANTVKDKRFIEPKYATGLWSRYGKAIQAPASFLDKLPNVILDGELFLGLGKQQELMSITATHEGTDWSDIKFMVLDSPPIERVFCDGVYDVRVGNVLYKIKLEGILPWIRNNGRHFISVGPDSSFEQVYGWLRRKFVGNENILLHNQVRLPFKTHEIKSVIDKELESVVQSGGEGLVFRNPVDTWKPERTHSALKYKPYQDDEAIVTGYTWGRETEFGSKLLGMMGNLIVNFKGKRFELSGFTDEERATMIYKHNNEPAFENGLLNAGQVVSDDIENKKFPRGSTITFRYRELSKDGIPKEARFLRQRLE